MTANIRIVILRFLRGFLIFILCAFAVAEKGAAAAPIKVIIPYGKDWSGYCLEVAASCQLGMAPRQSEYEEMRGQIKSESPDFVIEGQRIFALEMDDGKTIYYSTKLSSPFSKGDLQRLSDFVPTSAEVGKPVVEGAAALITKVEDVRAVGRKYTLSTGAVLYGSDLAVIRSMAEQYSKQVRTELIAALSQLSVEHDPFEGRFIVEAKRDLASLSSAPVQLYLICKNRKCTPWLKLYYSADDWLFVKSVTIKIGQTKREFSNLQFERDHSGSGVWEWHMRVASRDDLAVLRKTVSDLLTTVRFYGAQYYADKEVTERDKEQMRYLLSVLELSQ